jgi:hypothetical protein
MLLCQADQPIDVTALSMHQDLQDSQVSYSALTLLLLEKSATAQRMLATLCFIANSYIHYIFGLLY